MLKKPTKNKKRELSSLGMTLLFSLGLLASCNSASDSGAGAAVTHPDILPPLPTPTSAYYSFEENYAYNFNCFAALVHNCVLETQMAVGESVVGACQIETSNVEANTCLPDSVKNTILATEVPSVIVQRTEEAKYQVTVTLTQGHREVIEVNSLGELNLEKVDEEIGSL